MSTDRQSSPSRRLLVAVAIALLVVVGCQAPGDTTSGETGRNMTTTGADA